MESPERTKRNQRGILRKAVVFLLKEYLEKTHYSLQGQLDTADAFKDDAGIVNAGKRRIEKLRKRIDDAEAFLQELEAD